MFVIIVQSRNVDRIGKRNVAIQFAPAGISPENLKRVFDPFFTTRLGHGGSDLGMKIVYNLVTGVLGGRIQLDSAPGRGPTLTVILPLHAPGGGQAHAA